MPEILVGDKTGSCEDLRLEEIPIPGLIEEGGVIIGGGDLVVVLVVFSRLNCTV